MKTFKFLICILIISSCNSNKMSFHHEIGDGDSLIVYVEKMPDFGYYFSDHPILFQNDGYNTFEELDDEIFAYLKENTKDYKVCQFFVKCQNEDEYGNIQESYSRWNNIDLEELKKYKDSYHWSNNTCGVKYIKYGECK